VEVNGKPWPLAADFSAPVATLADHARALRRTAFEGMLDSRKIARREKMYLIQPYDPDRIPLLMIHGLKSTPVAFANLVNDLLADPEIRKRYQIWHYHYPTGTPVLMNAMTLRRVLDETTRQLDPDGRDFAMRNMVVIGHSMGGVISHTLAADSGWALWDSAVSRRPEQLAGPASAIQVLRDLYVFQHHPAVKRVIFIAAPHRGSIYADNWLGSLGQKLLHADPAVIEALRPAVEPNRAMITPFLVKLIDEGKVSSIRTLSGRSPALMALAGIRPSVPFHSIIGQKHAGPVEKGTDGFVAYPSSHLDGAESELIVPSGHNAYRSPQAVEEVRRILLEHLKTGRARP
jgi:pimeloyl-ACP methyl ester carboxylesterase